MHTFLWHDYETFGTDSRRDRPAQFAAVRTDAQLQTIGEAVNIFCQPAADYLPDPEACLITGITPAQALQQGLPEYRFAAAVKSALYTPGTIGAGYNSIRFDDEFTRFLLWRNLFDPYRREWHNNCSRWDLIDVARTARALRPEGIEWPQDENGTPSFRLENLAAANGLRHDRAHDALSDVEATIALARLLRQRQPRLFDYCLALRNKHHVRTIVSPKRPFLHISSMFGADNGCCAIVWPLAWHPRHNGELICWDLRHDPEVLATLTADEVRHRLFTPQADLPPETTRLPIKTIHLNRSPIVIAQLDTLGGEQAEQWHIDPAACLRHAEKARQLPDLTTLWQAVFTAPENTDCGADNALYQGFVGDSERAALNCLRSLEGDALKQALPAQPWQDPRLEELLFLYRARNFPHSLDADEQQRWQAHCNARLILGQHAARTLDDYLASLDALETSHPEAQELLAQLHEWAEQVCADGAF